MEDEGEDIVRAEGVLAEVGGQRAVNGLWVGVGSKVLLVEGQIGTAAAVGWVVKAYVSLFRVTSVARGKEKKRETPE